LRGPGILGEARLRVAGIDAAEWEHIRALQDFPLGVDVWLVARDGDLAVIPRSTQVRLET
jgi:alpha-D-ribose 1-methylphosphonate 5-triphosphate synthase subunit PhnH